MQCIAIAGATGYIGGRLVPRLLSAGYALRCLVRSPRKLEGREWTSDSRVEIRKSDLADAPSLTKELRGCDAAFYLVHSMMSADREYAQRDLDLALVFAKAAFDAGMGSIIYLGGLGENLFAPGRGVGAGVCGSAGYSSARGYDHWLGFGVIRDSSLSGPTLTNPDHAKVGHDPLPAHRRRERAHITGRRPVSAGHHRRCF